MWQEVGVLVAVKESILGFLSGLKVPMCLTVYNSSWLYESGIPEHACQNLTLTYNKCSTYSNIKHILQFTINEGWWNQVAAVVKQQDHCQMPTTRTYVWVFKKTEYSVSRAIDFNNVVFVISRVAGQKIKLISLVRKSTTWAWCLSYFHTQT